MKFGSPQGPLCTPLLSSLSTTLPVYPFGEGGYHREAGEELVSKVGQIHGEERRFDSGRQTHSAT